jgi:WD40 repeat protein
VAFSPNGRYFAAACADHVARIWDLGTRQELFQVKHEQQDGRVLFSPDSRYLLSAATGNVTPLQYSVVLSTVPDGKEVWRHTLRSWVTAIAFSQDGRYVAAAVWNAAHLWNAATGLEIRSFQHGYSVNGLAFSPDGGSVATACRDKTARIWSIATGSEKARFYHTGQVDQVTFSSDGALLATTSFNSPVRIWQVATRKELQHLQHENDVRHIEFSPDGKYLASASMDHTARVWDVSSGIEVARFALADEVNSVAFDLSGTYLATGSSDNAARIWQWRPEDLQSEACGRLVSNFTSQEWRQYLGDEEPYRKTCPSMR